MGKTDLQRGAFATVTFVALAVMAVCARSSAQTEHNDEFVQRDGTRLTLGGEAFRYSGPNIEWLGLEAYGPVDPMGPRYPSHFEVDDAMDTAKAMGARVIRSQTLGDSIGCDLCIEPKLASSIPRLSSTSTTPSRPPRHGLRLDHHPDGRLRQLQQGGVGQYFNDRGAAGT